MSPFEFYFRIEIRTNRQRRKYAQRKTKCRSNMLLKCICVHVEIGFKHTAHRAQRIRTAKYFRFYLSQVKHSQRRTCKRGFVFFFYIKFMLWLCCFFFHEQNFTRNGIGREKKSNHIHYKHRLSATEAPVQCHEVSPWTSRLSMQFK